MVNSRPSTSVNEQAIEKQNMSIGQIVSCRKQPSSLVTTTVTSKENIETSSILNKGKANVHD